MTLETDTTVGGGGFNVTSATSWFPHPGVCDGNDLLCQEVPSADGQNIGLFVFNTNALLASATPYFLGTAQTSRGLLPGDLNDNDVAANFGVAGFQDPVGAAIPYTYVVIPEPGTMVLLGAGLAGLAFLRRRSA